LSRPCLLIIDVCARGAYSAFLESVREFAPPAAALQPNWQRMPEPMKKAWRDSIRAAIDLYLEDRRSEEVS
jgi:hypothetical protein